MARATPIPVFAEMGSTNPVFLLPKALSERADKIAEALKNSVMMGVGQFCTKPGIVVAIDDAATLSFVKQLSALINTQPIGTMLNRRVAKAYSDGCENRAKTVQATRASATATLATQASAMLFTTTAKQFLSDRDLREELFGPSTLLVVCKSSSELMEVTTALDGQLTATIHAGAGELSQFPGLLETLERKVGRVILNGYPTGVEVCPAMHHGGPYPATTDSRATSVGTAAIERFARPVCFQDFSRELLPAELQDANPLGTWRLVDGKMIK
jgi:NADP-dependent aldehyde dehydrogenase